MKTREEFITELLKELGIPASVHGYHYLRYVINWIVETDGYLESVTKILYPEVARKFKTTPSRVERAVRHAVELGWFRGNAEMQQKLFGYSYSIEKGKPTNGEFIVTLADYVHLAQEDTTV